MANKSAKKFLTFTSKGMLVCAVLWSSSCSLVAPARPEITGQIVHHPFYSEIVKDNYNISVRLPPDFKRTPIKPYPVIFQLDAQGRLFNQFDVTSGYVSEMEKGHQIPSTIVVGIGYPYAPGPGTGRNRDYTIPIENEADPGTTGGAAAFYDFIKNELVPFISNSYPIAGSQSRALFGWSYGGLFAIYVFCQHDASNQFRGFVAASPALSSDGGSIYKYLDSLKANQVNVSRIMYMTIGDIEGPVQNVYFDDFTVSLRKMIITGLHFSSVKYNTDHAGTISPSFRDGITFLFSNGFGGTQ